MANKTVLHSTATTEKRFEPSKGKKVTVYPKITFDAEDVPELSEYGIGEECMLTVKVKKIWEGLEEYSDSKKPRVRVEVTGVAEHEEPKEKTKSLKEEMDERKGKAGY